MAFTDDFLRADNADLGANWTPVGSENAWKIATNKATPSNTTLDCSEVYVAGSFSDDQYAQGVLGTITTDSAGQGPGVIVRGTTAARTYYGVVCSTQGTELRKLVAGAFSAIHSDATVWANGDVVRLEVSGVSPNITLVVKRNGTPIAALGTTVETAIASGRPGLNFSGASATVCTIDDWEGGDLSAAATVALEWKQPTSQPTSHFTPTITSFLRAMPNPVPYLTTTPTAVTGALDWIQTSVDIYAT